MQVSSSTPYYFVLCVRFDVVLVVNLLPEHSAGMVGLSGGTWGREWGWSEVTAGHGRARGGFLLQDYGMEKQRDSERLQMLKSRCRKGFTALQPQALS